MMRQDHPHRLGHDQGCRGAPRGKGVMRRRPIALLCGLAADRLLPELPNRLHPVVWMGRWLALGERMAPGGAAAPWPRLAWGAAWCAAGMALCAAAARAIG